MYPRDLIGQVVTFKYIENGMLLTRVGLVDSADSDNYYIIAVNGERLTLPIKSTVIDQVHQAYEFVEDTIAQINRERQRFILNELVEQCEQAFDEICMLNKNETRSNLASALSDMLETSLEHD